MSGPALHPVRVLRAASVLTAAAIALGGFDTKAEASLEADDPRIQISDSLRGRSGRLTARIVRPAVESLPGVEPVSALFGTQAVTRPAVWVVRDSSSREPFHFITLRPFAEKREGRVGVYRVGRWPNEGRVVRNAAYRPPAGFIEVTEENRELQVSAHFRLEDFLDRSQPGVWPKPLVLDERLVDKLELLTAALQDSGYAGHAIRVLSGFRTPQSNARGARSGQSPESRHQYGDAADIIIDADGDGQMDDLNGDGRVDTKDAEILIRMIDAVEARHPELVGGAGLYRAIGKSGPFVHVDARGTRVRWGP
jgi:hypothetical protein